MKPIDDGALPLLNPRNKPFYVDLQMNTSRLWIVIIRVYQVRAKRTGHLNPFPNLLPNAPHNSPSFVRRRLRLLRHPSSAHGFGPLLHKTCAPNRWIIINAHRKTPQQIPFITPLPRTKALRRAASNMPTSRRKDTLGFIRWVVFPVPDGAATSRRVHARSRRKSPQNTSSSCHAR